MPFVISDSVFQPEGIPGISLGLSSGVKCRLWILWRRACQDHMVLRHSLGVVPEWCLSAACLGNGVNDPVTICLLFASLWRWSASCQVNLVSPRKVRSWPPIIITIPHGAIMIHKRNRLFYGTWWRVAIWYEGIKYRKWQTYLVFFIWFSWIRWDCLPGHVRIGQPAHLILINLCYRTSVLCDDSGSGLIECVMLLFIFK